MVENCIATSVDQNGVCAITLTRPRYHNALNPALITQLTTILQTMPMPSPWRAVVLRGAGPSFCAGADLRWLQVGREQSSADNEYETFQLQQLFQVINQCPIPVVALAHGAIFGGGIGLLAVCDHVIAHPGCVFAFSEVQLGLIPAVISPFVVAKMGISGARSLFLAGSKFDAAAAYHYHLVHEVTAELETSLQRYLAQLLTAGPQAVQAAKRLLARFSGDNNNGEIAQYTREQITQLRSGAEAQDRLQALLQQRPLHE